MAAPVLDLSSPYTASSLLAGPDPVNEPLDPSNNVDVNGIFGTRISDLLGYVELGAWTIVLVGLIGVGGMMGWSWISGKGFQALGRAGWVIGGAIVIGSATSIIDAFN